MGLESRTPPPAHTTSSCSSHVQRREADRKNRDTEAANKIREFFEDKFPGAGIGSVFGGENRTDKLEISKTATQLNVQHRGRRITIDVTGMDITVEAVEAKLRPWCRKEMGHAKISPRLPD